MKRKFWFGLLAAIVFATSAGFYGCNTENTPVVSSNDIFSDAAFVIGTMEPLEPIINDATMTSEVRLQNEDEFMPYNMDHNGRVPPRFFPLARIFREMELSEEQIVLVREIMIAHHKCIREAQLAYHMSVLRIIREANQAREEVMTKLRAGDITREEAMKAMQHINMRVREAMQNNPARERFHLAMKKCFEDMFASIRGVLTEEQQALWDEWVKKFKDNRPDRGNGPNRP